MDGKKLTVILIFSCYCRMTKFETLPPLVAKYGKNKGNPASAKTMELYKQLLNKIAKLGFDTKAKLLADSSGVIAVVTELTKDFGLETSKIDARRRYYSAIFWALSDASESQKSPFVKEFKSNMRDYSTGDVVAPYVPKVKVSFPSKDPIYFVSHLINKKVIVWSIVEKLKVGYRRVRALATLSENPDKFFSCEPIVDGPVSTIRFGGKEKNAETYQLSACSHSLETFKKVNRTYAAERKITLYVGEDMDIICS